MQRTRSPMEKFSSLDCSFFGRRASVLPMSRTRSGPSIRFTTQVTSSPTRWAYSVKIVSRSASRSFCKMTCLNVWAETRLKPSAFLGKRTSPPTSALASIFFASDKEISCAGSAASSTIFLTAKICNSPEAWSNSAASSSVVLKCLRAATSMASFTASITICGSIPFSLLRISID